MYVCTVQTIIIHEMKYLDDIRVGQSSYFSKRFANDHFRLLYIYTSHSKTKNFVHLHKFFTLKENEKLLNTPFNSKTFRWNLTTFADARKELKKLKLIE